MALTVPGPDPLPIATYKFARDPYSYFTDCQRRFGPLPELLTPPRRVRRDDHRDQEPEHANHASPPGS